MVKFRIKYAKITGKAKKGDADENLTTIAVFDILSQLLPLFYRTIVN